ncbi:hypothetical protein [Streptomyces sp. LUP30]|uniref:hypothetical protein n=1 Tax=Streptomyces sp. LUP30 TaxID=1890285 RepID=UPI0008518263|nr:hypothetical protein [Streptomyces sp. LUP30]
MPWIYECRACEARSPEERERRDDAEDELVEHRRRVHGGLRPDAGDEVRRVHAAARGDGVLPAGWGWALLVLLALLLANCRGW